jgi:hypothetical protein
MPALSYTCPKTRQRAPSGIQTDLQSLQASWPERVKINCSLCGRVHEFAVREMYTEGILRDVTDQSGRA